MQHFFLQNPNSPIPLYAGFYQIVGPHVRATAPTHRACHRAQPLKHTMPPLCKEAWCGLGLDCLVPARNRRGKREKGIMKTHWIAARWWGGMDASSPGTFLLHGSVAFTRWLSRPVKIRSFFLHQSAVASLFPPRTIHVSSISSFTTAAAAPLPSSSARTAPFSLFWSARHATQRPPSLHQKERSSCFNIV